MNFKEFYNWDEETGKATVKLEDNQGHIFWGIAQCHPDDRDIINQNIGLEIADIRARLNAIRHIRDNEVKPALKILLHLQYSMKNSKYYNPKSYEARMLNRQIRMHKSDLKNIKQIINDYKAYMKGLLISAAATRNIKNNNEQKNKMDENE